MTNKAEDIEPYTNLKGDRSPRDPHKLHTAVQSDADVREAMREIFTEYDKPSTTKTYPGQKTTVRRGIAIDQIVDFFQVRERQLRAEAELQLRKDNAFIKAVKRDVRQQLLTELLSHSEGVEYPHKRYGGDYEGKAVSVSVIEAYISQTKDSDTPQLNIYQDDTQRQGEQLDNVTSIESRPPDQNKTNGGGRDGD